MRPTHAILRLMRLNFLFLTARQRPPTHESVGKRLHATGMAIGLRTREQHVR